jgi:hypothetical protein
MTAYTEGGYKYRLEEDLILYSSIRDFNICFPFIQLMRDGRLTVCMGYACDGPSGPTADMWLPRWFWRWVYRKFLMPSIGHDAIYQLIRHGHLPEEFRVVADEDLARWCLERGMWKIRAKWILIAVKYFANFAADPKHKRKVYKGL